VKIIKRTLIASAVAGTPALGFTGVAGAQALEYDVDVAGATVTDPAGQETAAAAVSSSGTLPYTGTDSSLPLAEIGAGLLAAGGLAVVVVRRQQVKAEA
jgi:LPXTG-motif cell wall-anchored protein